MPFIPYVPSAICKAAEKAESELRGTAEYAEFRNSWSRVSVAAMAHPNNQNPLLNDELCEALGSWVMRYNRFIDPL